MKVSFKLTAEQLQRAQAAVRELASLFARKDELLTQKDHLETELHHASWDVTQGWKDERQCQISSIEAELKTADMDNMRPAGNCWALYVPGFYVNVDVELNLKGGILIFQGQRCPLVQDGCMDQIIKIAGFQPPTINENEFGSVFKVRKAAWMADVISKLPEVLEVVEYHTSDKRLQWWETLSSYMWDRASIDEVLAHYECDDFIEPLLKERFPEVLKNARLYLKDRRQLYACCNTEERELARRASLFLKD